MYGVLTGGLPKSDFEISSVSDLVVLELSALVEFSWSSQLSLSFELSEL